MNLRWLESFIATHDCGSIAKAAVVLKVGQPAVSKHIMSLERCLGVPLFCKKVRPVQLSSAGRRLLPVARNVVASLKDVVVEQPSD
ncbi:LysR family transcriptional regulator [Pseudomonas sp. I2]|uniref:LysR family transcriptional regulator n=1 Tax=Pseudomonas sp. I2 TaxID=1338438 RepID=UPI0034D42E50